MIKGTTTEPVCLGTSIELERHAILKKSVLKKASFAVGQEDAAGNVKKSHDETVIVDYLSDDRKADLVVIDEALRRIWDDMTDEEKYYDRSKDAPTE